MVQIDMASKTVEVPGSFWLFFCCIYFFEYPKGKLLLLMLWAMGKIEIYSLNFEPVDISAYSTRLQAQ